MLTKLCGGVAGMAFTTSVVFFRGLIAPEAVQQPIVVDVLPQTALVQPENSGDAQPTLRALTEGFGFADLVKGKAVDVSDVLSSEDLRRTSSAKLATNKNEDELWGSLLAKVEQFDDTQNLDEADRSDRDQQPPLSTASVRRIASASFVGDGNSKSPGFGLDQLGLDTFGQLATARSQQNASRPAAFQFSRRSNFGNRSGQSGFGGAGVRSTPMSGGGLSSRPGGGNGQSFAQAGMVNSGMVNSGMANSIVPSSGGTAANAAAVSRVFERVASAASVSSPVVQNSTPARNEPASIEPAPSINQLADNGRPQLTADGKFGIPNHQYWTFDFDENTDGLDGIDKRDADLQFESYLTELDGLLRDANQVVKFSPDELRNIYNDLNDDIPKESAKSPDFLTFMIIDFPVKGFYLPEASIPDNPSLPAGAVD